MDDYGIGEGGREGGRGEGAGGKFGKLQIVSGRDDILTWCLHAGRSKGVHICCCQYSPC